MVMTESEELREQARNQHIAGETTAAIALLTEAIQQDPGNTLIAMDMVQIFIDINELEQATGLFNKLPELDKQSDTGKMLQGQLTVRNLAADTEGIIALQARIAVNAQDYGAHFDLAICLVAEHDYQQAMEHLFEILTREPEFKEGAAREMIIALTDKLAPNEPALAQSFRRRLANTLL